VEPITAVIFDFHMTLVDGGDGGAWLAQGAEQAGERLPPDAPAIAEFLADVWGHAVHFDPDGRRDLYPELHREVFDELVAEAAEDHGWQLSDALVDALYSTVADQWRPYLDAEPTLAALAAAGVKVAVVSNVGIDITDLFELHGFAPHLDAIVLSCREGALKPDPRIFSAALQQLGAAPGETLMVGDSPSADAGAVGVGIRTLLLPPVSGRVRGLDAVLRLVGVSAEA